MKKHVIFLLILYICCKNLFKKSVREDTVGYNKSNKHYYFRRIYSRDKKDIL